jgi:HPt (histidine-containing phosphotransfer) domain-containing protein
VNGESRERLTSKLAELGQRYLHRTSEEVMAMRVAAEQFANGHRAVLYDIERAAHRIRGSGGMFGFDAISAAASAIEVAVADPVTGAQLIELIDCLDAAVQAALRNNPPAS